MLGSCCVAHEWPVFRQDLAGAASTWIVEVVWIPEHNHEMAEGAARLQADV